jgi:cyclopropane-fatty-acyl-phospholipid synthase
MFAQRNLVGAQTNDARSLTLGLLDQLFRGSQTLKVGVRLWDSTLWPDEATRPATLVLNHPGALRAMLMSGTEVGLAEAFLYDDFDIEGDIESVFELSDHLAAATQGGSKKLGAAKDLLRLPAKENAQEPRRGPVRLTGKLHSVARDRQAVTSHYDVSNDFYALWLDQRMVYSCAYFQTIENDLDTAQEQKLDLICRKLRLKPGQRLLDLGCGWGGLVMHAAKHYGVDATGITLSQPQAELATKRIAEARLVDRCRVIVRDYREMKNPDGYDALVSVGMFEHVGAGKLSSYFAQASQLLKPGGAFLNHGIANRAMDKPIRGSTFTNTYVFPDGELVPINVTLQAAELCGFEVRDVESLREHYALTLRHWTSRLEGHHAEALKYVDERTYRIWRLFMSGSAYGFTSGELNLYQALLVKPRENGQSGLPLTREDLYTR